MHACMGMSMWDGLAHYSIVLYGVNSITGTAEERAKFSADYWAINLEPL